MTAATVPPELKEALEDLEIILNHLSNPNNLSGSDGEHVRAILAQSGHKKLARAYDLIEQVAS